MSMAVAPGAAVRRPILFILLFVLLVPLFAQAQSGVWGARGSSHEFLIRGNRLFDVDGRGVAVYDVANPAKIVRTGVTTTAAEALDGAFVDANTLVVVTTADIERFAVSNDGALTLLSQIAASGLQRIRSNGRWVAAAGATRVIVYDTTLAQPATYYFDGTISAIALAGDALYVAQGANGISVVDLTGAVPNGALAEYANDVVVSNDTLAIASGVTGLVVADISNPLVPRVVGRTGAGSMNLARVAISGTRVYAGESPNLVYVFDVARPQAPQLVKQTEEPVQVLAADAAHVYVSGSTFDRFGIATETGVPLRILDASSLTIAGTFTDLAGPVSGVATDGTLAYVIDHPMFRVIDISNTAAPREIASMPLPDVTDRVSILGKQVILFGRGDVDLIDVSNPYGPKLLDVFHSFGRPPSNAAFTRGNIIEGNPWSGFHVMDFADYSPPGQIGGIKGHYYDVVANGGDAAYIAAEGQALAAIDLSDPRAPHATKVIPGAVRQMVIVTATTKHPDLLLVRGTEGITIYSIGNAISPVELGFAPFDNPTIVGGGGDSALVGTDSGLVQLDLSDPARPHRVPAAVAAVAPMQIAVSGGKTVVADRYALRVYGPNTAPPPLPPHHRAARP